MASSVRIRKLSHWGRKRPVRFKGNCGNYLVLSVALVQIVLGTIAQAKLDFDSVHTDEPHGEDGYNYQYVPYYNTIGFDSFLLQGAESFGKPSKHWQKKIIFKRRKKSLVAGTREESNNCNNNNNGDNNCSVDPNGGDEKFQDAKDDDSKSIDSAQLKKVESRTEQKIIQEYNKNQESVRRQNMEIAAKNQKLKEEYEKKKLQRKRAKMVRENWQDAVRLSIERREQEKQQQREKDLEKTKQKLKKLKEEDKDLEMKEKQLKTIMSFNQLGSTGRGKAEAQLKKITKKRERHAKIFAKHFEKLESLMESTQKTLEEAQEGEKLDINDTAQRVEQIRKKKYLEKIEKDSQKVRKEMEKVRQIDADVPLKEMPLDEEQRKKLEEKQRAKVRRWTIQPDTAYNAERELRQAMRGMAKNLHIPMTPPSVESIAQQSSSDTDPGRKPSRNMPITLEESLKFQGVWHEKERAVEQAIIRRVLDGEFTTKAVKEAEKFAAKEVKGKFKDKLRVSQIQPIVEKHRWYYIEHEPHIYHRCFPSDFITLYTHSEMLKAYKAEMAIVEEEINKLLADDWISSHPDSLLDAVCSNSDHEKLPSTKSLTKPKVPAIHITASTGIGGGRPLWLDDYSAKGDLSKDANHLETSPESPRMEERSGESVTQKVKEQKSDEKSEESSKSDSPTDVRESVTDSSGESLSSSMESSSSTREPSALLNPETKVIEMWKQNIKKKQEKTDDTEHSTEQEATTSPEREEIEDRPGLIHVKPAPITYGLPDDPLPVKSVQGANTDTTSGVNTVKSATDKIETVESVPGKSTNETTEKEERDLPPGVILVKPAAITYGIPESDLSESLPKDKIDKKPEENLEPTISSRLKRKKTINESLSDASWRAAYEAALCDEYSVDPKPSTTTKSTPAKKNSESDVSTLTMVKSVDKSQETSSLENEIPQEKLQEVSSDQPADDTKPEDIPTGDSNVKEQVANREELETCDSKPEQVSTNKTLPIHDIKPVKVHKSGTDSSQSSWNKLKQFIKTGNKVQKEDVSSCSSIPESKKEQHEQVVKQSSHQSSSWGLLTQMWKRGAKKSKETSSLRDPVGGNIEDVTSSFLDDTALKAENIESTTEVVITEENTDIKSTDFTTHKHNEMVSETDKMEMTTSGMEKELPKKESREKKSKKEKITKNEKFGKRDKTATQEVSGTKTEDTKNKNSGWLGDSLIGKLLKFKPKWTKKEKDSEKEHTTFNKHPAKTKKTKKKKSAETDRPKEERFRDGGSQLEDECPITEFSQLGNEAMSNQIIDDAEKYRPEGDSVEEDMAKATRKKYMMMDISGSESDDADQAVERELQMTGKEMKPKKTDDGKRISHTVGKFRVVEFSQEQDQDETNTNILEHKNTPCPDNVQETQKEIKATKTLEVKSSNKKRKRRPKVQAKKRYDGYETSTASEDQKSIESKNKKELEENRVTKSKGKKYDPTERVTSESEYSGSNFGMTVKNCNRKELRHHQGDATTKDDKEKLDILDVPAIVVSSSEGIETTISVSKKLSKKKIAQRKSRAKAEEGHLGVEREVSQDSSCDSVDSDIICLKPAPYKSGKEELTPLNEYNDTLTGESNQELQTEKSKKSKSKRDKEHMDRSSKTLRSHIKAKKTETKTDEVKAEEKSPTSEKTNQRDSVVTDENHRKDIFTEKDENQKTKSKKSDSECKTTKETCKSTATTNEKSLTSEKQKAELNMAFIYDSSDDSAIVCYKPAPYKCNKEDKNLNTVSTEITTLSAKNNEATWRNDSSKETTRKDTVTENTMNRDQMELKTIKTEAATEQENTDKEDDRAETDAEKRPTRTLVEEKGQKKKTEAENSKREITDTTEKIRSEETKGTEKDNRQETSTKETTDQANKRQEENTGAIEKHKGRKNVKTDKSFTPEKDNDEMAINDDSGKFNQKLVSSKTCKRTVPKKVCELSKETGKEKWHRRKAMRYKDKGELSVIESQRDKMESGEAETKTKKSTTLTSHKSDSKTCCVAKSSKRYPGDGGKRKGRDTEDTDKQLKSEQTEKKELNIIATNVTLKAKRDRGEQNKDERTGNENEKPQKVKATACKGISTENKEKKISRKMDETTERLHGKERAAETERTIKENLLKKKVCLDSDVVVFGTVTEYRKLKSSAKDLDRRGKVTGAGLKFKSGIKARQDILDSDDPDAMHVNELYVDELKDDPIAKTMKISKEEINPKYADIADVDDPLAKTVLIKRKEADADIDDEKDFDELPVNTNKQYVVLDDAEICKPDPLAKTLRIKLKTTDGRDAGINYGNEPDTLSTKAKGIKKKQVKTKNAMIRNEYVDELRKTMRPNDTEARYIVPDDRDKIDPLAKTMKIEQKTTDGRAAQLWYEKDLQVSLAKPKRVKNKQVKTRDMVIKDEYDDILQKTMKQKDTETTYMGHDDVDELDPLAKTMRIEQKTTDGRDAGLEHDDVLYYPQEETVKIKHKKVHARDMSKLEQTKLIQGTKCKEDKDEIVQIKPNKRPSSQGLEKDQQKQICSKEKSKNKTKSNKEGKMTKLQKTEVEEVLPPKDEEQQVVDDTKNTTSYSKDIRVKKGPVKSKKVPKQNTTEQITKAKKSEKIEKAQKLKKAEESHLNSAQATENKQKMKERKTNAAARKKETATKKPGEKPNSDAPVDPNGPQPLSLCERIKQLFKRGDRTKKNTELFKPEMETKKSYQENYLSEPDSVCTEEYEESLTTDTESVTESETQETESLVPPKLKAELREISRKAKGDKDFDDRFELLCLRKHNEELTMKNARLRRFNSALKAENISLVEEKTGLDEEISQLKKYMQELNIRSTKPMHYGNQAAMYVQPNYHKACLPVTEGLVTTGPIQALVHQMLSLQNQMTTQYRVMKEQTKVIEALQEERLKEQRGKLIKEAETMGKKLKEESVAQSKQNTIGWFPANYVSHICHENSENRTSTKPNTPAYDTAATPVTPFTTVEQVVARHNYMGQKKDELTFTKGSLINVLNRDCPNWWLGELNGVQGVFPTNYVSASSTAIETDMSSD